MNRKIEQILEAHASACEEATKKALRELLDAAIKAVRDQVPDAREVDGEGAVDLCADAVEDLAFGSQSGIRTQRI